MGRRIHMGTGTTGEIPLMDCYSIEESLSGRLLGNTGKTEGASYLSANALMSAILIIAMTASLSWGQ